MALHGLEAEYYEQINRNVASLDAVIATNRLACELASSLGGLENQRIYHAPCGVSSFLEMPNKSLFRSHSHRLCGPLRESAKTS